MIEVKGNLLDMARAGEFNIIFHGCNCFHTMGAGIAKQIREQFPEAHKADLATPYGDISKLGTYSMVDVLEGKLKIVNLYTQFEPGANFEYAALQMALSLYFGETYSSEPSRYGFPWIGAGIGGGRWEIIKQVIDLETNWMKDHTVTLVEFDDPPAALDEKLMSHAIRTALTKQ